jgi:hypothetical protein
VVPISASDKILTLFCHSHSVLNSFRLLGVVVWLEFDLIQVRKVLNHFSPTIALHVDIQWLFSWPLPMAHWYDSMAFLEKFPWNITHIVPFLSDINLYWYVWWLHI